MLKNIVIGLDGATFGLLNKWIEGGSLPVFKKLMTGGAHAVMNSCLPPVTCPNWKCYSTGKGPGKLGVYWWEIVDVQKRKIESVRYAEHVLSKEIWDIMNTRGYRTAVINMPTTYPPKEINGSIIAGGPDCPNENFTYPKDLEKEIKDRFNYKVHLDGIGKIKKGDKRAISDVTAHIRQTFDVTRDLITKNSYDFIHTTIFCTSIVQHFLWDDDFVKEVWRYIDQEIGRLCSEIPEGCGVIIMSDHGMRKISREFYINRWLEQEGYLFRKKAESTSLYSSSRLGGLLKRLGSKTGLERLGILAGASNRGAIREEKAKMIDWDSSKVIASGQGPIYLIDNEQSGEYIKLRSEIIKRLEELKDPVTGKNMAEKVLRREDVYPVVLSGSAPDIILIPDADYRVNGELAESSPFVDCKRWAAENDQPGIFFAFGRDIKEGTCLQVMNITDLAPTILHWMDIPVPQDMDGRVLKEIFKPGSSPYNRDINTCFGDTTSGGELTGYDKEEEEMVRKRLKELGYMDG